MAGTKILFLIGIASLLAVSFRALADANEAGTVMACVEGLPSGASQTDADTRFYGWVEETNNRLKNIGENLRKLIDNELLFSEFGGDERAASEQRWLRYIEVTFRSGRVRSDARAGISFRGTVYDFFTDYYRNDHFFISIYWPMERLPSGRGWDPGFAVISARRRVIDLLERPLRATIEESTQVGGSEAIPRYARDLLSEIRAFRSSSFKLKEYYDCVYDREAAAAAARVDSAVGGAPGNSGEAVASNRSETVGLETESRDFTAGGLVPRGVYIGR